MSEHAERALDQEATAAAPRAGTDAVEGARPSLNLELTAALTGRPPPAPRDPSLFNGGMFTEPLDVDAAVEAAKPGAYAPPVEPT